MISKLERVVVAVDDLEAATRDYERLLGRSPSSAEDGIFALRNTALQLVDRASTEIAGGTAPAEGVAALVFREDERDASEWLALDATRGIPIGLGRESADDSPLAEAVVAQDQTATALDHVVIHSGDLDAARALYGDRLGLRLALDRSFEERGIQILFYRVGSTTVEVVAELAGAHAREGVDRAGDGTPASQVRSDRFGGLAWEVDDLRAIRRRLAEEDFDVSEHRIGHKPGTRVCTVRSRTHGVQTLLKGLDLG